jgi:DNA-binding protein HU-beta
MTMPTSNLQFPALRILVVEDNALLALDVKATLAELGYCVIGPVDAVAPALQIINTSIWSPAAASASNVVACSHEMVASFGKHLKKGSRIRISGLGILQVRKRAARMGRNPATGEAIKIKASKKVAFRAAKDLKEAI